MPSRGQRIRAEDSESEVRYPRKVALGVESRDCKLKREVGSLNRVATGDIDAYKDRPSVSPQYSAVESSFTAR
jgi:hypothetical protein